jgi:hypothetical protein
VSPDEAGNYYYASTLEVSTLSDTDLDELDRFLEGDVDGGGQVGLGETLERGATRVLLRLAGLPSLRLEARTRRFTIR